MSEITVRPMMPEDWTAVSKIYLEGIATEHATFQTNCPPYTAWDASHTRECRLVVLDDGVVAGWAALHRVDPRWCYRGVAEVSIYVGEKFRGKGLGYHLLTALCREAEQAGYWTLQSTVLQDNAPSRGLHLKCGFRVVGRRERIARDCHHPFAHPYRESCRAVEPGRGEIPRGDFAGRAENRGPCGAPCRRAYRHRPTVRLQRADHVGS